MNVSVPKGRVAVFLFGACGLVALGFVAGRSDVVIIDGAGVSGGGPAGPASLTIRSTTQSALLPGMLSPIDVAVQNAGEQAMVIGDLTVSVDAVDAPGADGERPCTTADFLVVQPASSLTMTVAPGENFALSQTAHASTTWPQVGLIDRATNQDGCKGATVTLSFAATGSAR